MSTRTPVAVHPPSKDQRSGAVTPSEQELEAARGLVRAARDRGVSLSCPGGLLKALTKTVIVTAFDEDLNEHLGYDKHDPVGLNRVNSRSGKWSKTVLTDAVGEVKTDVPRDRDSTFEPVIVRNVTAPQRG